MYIEVRLDHFFGATQWLVDHPTAVVQHVKRYASNHSLLMLDTIHDQRRRKARFYFDKRWIQKPKFGQLIKEVLGAECEGSPMPR